MRFPSPLLVPCLAVLACSGRYEVGAENALGGGGTTSTTGSIASSGRGSATPSGGSTFTGAPSPAGGSAAGGAGPAFDASDCDFTAVPQPAPPYASPGMVWARVSRFVFDRVVEPPTALPEETTPEWAGSIALSALDETRQLSVGPPGIRRFLANWLQVDRQQAFELHWPGLLDSDDDALELLLTTPLEGPGRVGIFTEPAFLVAHPSIGARGAAVHQALWNEQVPTAPMGMILPKQPPGKNRRTWLAEEVSAPNCIGCHTILDPLGFALEHFDELGQYREADGGLPVDSSGTLWVPVDDTELTFGSMVDLAPQLVNTCAATLGFVNANYDDAVVAGGLYESAYDIPEYYAADRERVSAAFILGDRSYRALVQGIAQSEAFLR